MRLTIFHNSKSNVEFIELGENAPFRTLSYQSKPVPRMAPKFYDRSHLKAPRSQESILRASGYQLKTPKLIFGEHPYHIRKNSIKLFLGVI